MVPTIPSPFFRVSVFSEYSLGVKVVDSYLLILEMRLFSVCIAYLFSVLPTNHRQWVIYTANSKTWKTITQTAYSVTDVLCHQMRCKQTLQAHAKGDLHRLEVWADPSPTILTNHCLLGVHLRLST